MSKTWFITGTSKGFGRVWAEAALDRGDNVVATARSVESLSELKNKYGDNVLTQTLDITNKAAVEETIKRGHDTFGRLDVIVNNAGYGQFGAVEELSEQEVRDQIETNLLGTLWVTQAALPFLREQGSGHIIQVSSISGVNAFPLLGMYSASKWATEGLSQSLAQEVKPMGIYVTLVEPVGYSTDWAGPSANTAKKMTAYDALRKARKDRPSKSNSHPGDPEATGPVMLKLVDMDEPPLRIFFGDWANEMIHAEYDKRLAEWDKYNSLSVKAHSR